MDLFGSNAKPEGGIFGRVDGVYISIEAQKSAGSLHFHAQVFVQGLHQYEPLRTIYERICNDEAFSVQPFLRYAEHVARQVLADPVGWSERRPDREEAWPEYKHALDLVSTPPYLSARFDPASLALQAETTHEQREEGARWLQEY